MRIAQPRFSVFPSGGQAIQRRFFHFFEGLKGALRKEGRTRLPHRGFCRGSPSNFPSQGFRVGFQGRTGFSGRQVFPRKKVSGFLGVTVFLGWRFPGFPVKGGRFSGVCTVFSSFVGWLFRIPSPRDRKTYIRRSNRRGHRRAGCGVAFRFSAWRLVSERSTEFGWTDSRPVQFV